MKSIQLVILIVLCSIVLISCDKMDFKKDISGNWRLDFAGGGIVPHELETNYTNLVLKKNKEYAIFSNDTLKTNGIFSVLTYSEYPPKPYEPFYLRFEIDAILTSIKGFPFNENLDVIFNSQDTLILSDWAADGAQWFFIKKK